MSYGNCPKKYKTIATFTTNGNDPSRSSWDLTPYKTAGMGPPGGTWRIIEVGYNLQYQTGKIAADGTLVANDYQPPTVNAIATRAAYESTPSGLPDSFDSHYSYDGYMELQVEEPEEECEK